MFFCIRFLLDVSKARVFLSHCGLLFAMLNIFAWVVIA